MLRDGIVMPLGFGSALPLDVNQRAHLRLNAVASLAPRRSVITGSAALWTHFGGAPPAQVDAVVPNGVHVVPDHPYVHIHCRADADECDSVAGAGNLASPARALLDALRWSPPEDALPRVLAALSQHQVTTHAVEELLMADDPRGRSHAKMRSLWEAVRAH